MRLVHWWSHPERPDWQLRIGRVSINYASKWSFTVTLWLNRRGH